MLEQILKRLQDLTGRKVDAARWDTVEIRWLADQLHLATSRLAHLDDSFYPPPPPSETVADGGGFK